MYLDKVAPWELTTFEVGFFPLSYGHPTLLPFLMPGSVVLHATCPLGRLVSLSRYARTHNQRDAGALKPQLS